MIKLATLAQALVVAAGLALAPAAAFAQAAPTTTAPKVAKPAEVKTPQQTAEAACAVHKKESKEHRECLDKNKPAANKAMTKDPAKKS